MIDLSYLPWIVMMLERALFTLIGITAIVGAVMVILTRDDAFSAADRHPKMIWFAILMLSGIVLVVSFRFPIPILPWVAAVATGIYWFDVRPHIQGLIRGDYRY